jgi:hypothetical protein
MKFLLKQGKERVEIMENKGTKIKEVFWSTIVSYEIH